MKRNRVWVVENEYIEGQWRPVGNFHQTRRRARDFARYWSTKYNSKHRVREYWDVTGLPQCIPWGL